MINLGDKVKDTISGYTGIAVASTEYLQGCNRISVQAHVNKNEKPEEWQVFDEPQLEVIKKKVIKQGGRVVGGYKQHTAIKNF